MLKIKKIPRQETIPCCIVRDDDIVELLAQMTGAWGAYEHMTSQGKELRFAVFGTGCADVTLAAISAFAHLGSTDDLTVELGQIREAPGADHIANLMEIADDIPFADLEDVENAQGARGFCIPDALGATSRHMMFLDGRNPEGRFEIERKKLSLILSMFYFITDEELADIGYEQQGYASTGAEGIARAGRNIEQRKQAFATIF